MEFKDYYDIMGVARDASQDEIKRAYRKLARKFHPDVSKEADTEQRFKALGEAYEVLKDPEKRAAYDQLGANWRDGQEFRPPPDWSDGFEFSGGGYTNTGHADFSDFFESLFGGAARRGGPRGFNAGGAGGHGADHHASIDIGLEDAYEGRTLSLELGMPAVDAQGRVSHQPRKLQVKVPRGVSNGKRIRLPGQGAPGFNGGPAGDLYLEVRLRPHPMYEVEGRDVYLTLPITPWEAALGAKLKVPTLGGPVELSVPAGARSGQKLRLKGRGLAAAKGDPGDQIVVMQIATPPADSDEAKALYAKMADELPFNPRAKLGV